VKTAGGEDFSPADGILAPPMSNGEVVFEAPWQGRVFGMAVAMAAAGVFEWDEFRACLIEELAGRESAPEAPFHYYGHFLRSLERLLSDKGLLDQALLGERFATYRDRPHGHDHG
jgi:nitrile hydratase accessory protein